MRNPRRVPVRPNDQTPLLLNIAVSTEGAFLFAQLACDEFSLNGDAFHWSQLPVNSTELPAIHIEILDEQSSRQDELRELYLRWISENEVRNHDVKAPIKLTPTKENLNPGW